MLCIVCFSFLFSCKKDEEPEPVVQQSSGTSNYGQLKTGNYWIYQIYDVDSLGNATPTTDFDSCYVAKDTIINGNIYFEMHRPGATIPNPISYLRDSATYIVNNYGKIVFSSTDFSSTFSSSYNIAPPTDTIYKTITRMTDKNVSVSTPAGTFITSNYQISSTIWPSWVVYFSTLNQNTRYSKDIGIVTETMPIFLSSSSFKERHLVSYNVN